MKKQKGFTLLELIVTLAIVGVLTSLALPTYQDYLTKAKLLEGVLLLDRLMSDVEITYNTTGELPNYVMGSEENATTKMTDSGMIRDFRYKNTSNKKFTRGWVRIRFDSASIPGCVKNKCAVYTGFIVRNGELDFYCGLWNPNWGDFPITLMPQNCQEPAVFAQIKK